MLHLLKWDTPLNPSFGDYLRVVNKNTSIQVPYEGPMVKRGNPGVDSYTSLSEGETLTMKINILKNYPVHKAGVYKLKLSFVFLDYSLNTLVVKKKEHFIPSGIVESNEIEIELIGSRVPKVVNESSFSNKGKRVVQSYSHRDCTTSQLSSVQTGWTTFKNMVMNADTEINKGNTLNYRTWFGAYLSSRYSRAKYVIGALYQFSLRSTTCIFDCYPPDCDSDVFAYVYPNDASKVVYLCSQYWPSPAGGNGAHDTKGGVILHELSHFDAISNPGNDDIAYGETKLRLLALNDPSSTVYNADSYEYFAEYVY